MAGGRGGHNDGLEEKPTIAKGAFETVVLIFCEAARAVPPLGRLESIMKVLSGGARVADR